MKIPKKVAKGIAITGLVGIIGGFGSMVYSAIKLDEQYPDLVEIEQQSMELKGKYPQCFSSPINKSYECNNVRGEYVLLLEEKVPFVEREEHYSNLKHNSGTGTMLSLFLAWAGLEISSRRRNEEWDEKTEKHNKEIEEIRKD